MQSHCNKAHEGVAGDCAIKRWCNKLKYSTKCKELRNSLPNSFDAMQSLRQNVINWEWLLQCFCFNWMCYLCAACRMEWVRISISLANNLFNSHSLEPPIYMLLLISMCKGWGRWKSQTPLLIYVRHLRGFIIFKNWPHFKWIHSRSNDEFV